MNENITPTEIRKQIIKDFAYFLKSKNIYVEFRTNIANSLATMTHKYTLGFFYGFEHKILLGDLSRLSYNRAISLVNFAFYWNGTKQGDSFWRNLHQEWANYVEKHYKQYITLINRN